MKKNIWFGICVIVTIGFGLFIFENTDKIENFKTIFSQKSEKNDAKGVKKEVKTETKKTEIKSSMESGLFVNKNEEVAEDREVYIEELLYPEEYEWTEEEHGKVMLEAGKKFIADYNRFVNLKNGDIFSINIEGKKFQGVVSNYEYKTYSDNKSTSTYYYLKLFDNYPDISSISASKLWNEEKNQYETKILFYIHSKNGRYKGNIINNKGIYSEYRRYNKIFSKYYKLN
jgi:hypothetical protein